MGFSGQPDLREHLQNKISIREDDFSILKFFLAPRVMVLINSITEWLSLADSGVAGLLRPGGGMSQADSVCVNPASAEAASQGRATTK